MPIRRTIAALLAALGTLGLAACGQAQPQLIDGPPERGSFGPTLLAGAEYPEMARCPDEADYETPQGFDDEGYTEAWSLWWEEHLARRDAADAYRDTALTDALARLIPQLMTGEGTAVCSPVDVYLALALLADATAGATQDQLLALLGAADDAALRDRAAAIWTAHYCDDGLVLSRPASSLWLRDDQPYDEATVTRLAADHHASVFRGPMGAASYDGDLQHWLDTESGYLLSDLAAGVHLDPQTVLALATAVRYQARWETTFAAADTAAGTFHAPEGDVTCDFLHGERDLAYYAADRFAAVGLPLQDSGALWLLLPDEGIAPRDLLTDAAAFVLAGGAGTPSRSVVVDLALPKFDVTAERDLTADLRALGVTDVLDPDRADFSPLLPEGDAALSRATHAARVTVDEEGVTAAAFTVLAMDGAGLPPEERVSFVLDRPFLFAVTGEDGLPLFFGVVETV